MGHTQFLECPNSHKLIHTRPSRYIDSIHVWGCSHLQDSRDSFPCQTFSRPANKHHKLLTVHTLNLCSHHLAVYSITARIVVCFQFSVLELYTWFIIGAYFIFRMPPTVLQWCTLLLVSTIRDSRRYKYPRLVAQPLQESHSWSHSLLVRLFPCQKTSIIN